MSKQPTDPAKTAKHILSLKLGRKDLDKFDLAEGATIRDALKKKYEELTKETKE